jgi:hypothetical protein
MPSDSPRRRRRKSSGKASPKHDALPERPPELDPETLAARERALDDFRRQVAEMRESGDRLLNARAADYLGDPADATWGSFARNVHDLRQLEGLAQAAPISTDGRQDPVLIDRILRRNQWLSDLPRWGDLQKYVARERLRGHLADVVMELESRLVEKLDQTPRDVALLPFARAVAVLIDPAISSGNEERDRYIYDRYKDGIKLRLIRTEVNGKLGCTHLGSEDAVLKAMRRFCKRHKINVPTRKQKRTRQD